MAEQSIAFRLTLPLDGLRDAMLAAPDVMLRELAPAVTQGSLLMEREIRDRTPTSGAGTLRDGIGALPVTFLDEIVSGGVGTAVAYAQPVETGSKPHMPPIEPLADWVRRKLGIKGDEARAVAQRIAWKIKKHGTKGAHMFAEGFAATEAQVREEIAAAAGRGLAEIGS